MEPYMIYLIVWKVPYTNWVPFEVRTTAFPAADLAEAQEVLEKIMRK